MVNRKQALAMAILAATVTVLLVYAAWAFVLWDANPANWGYRARAFSMICAAGCASFSFFFAMQAQEGEG